MIFADILPILKVINKFNGTINSAAPNPDKNANPTSLYSKYSAIPSLKTKLHSAWKELKKLTILSISVDMKFISWPAEKDCDNLQVGT